jgi:CubicO group peptidase (beta-lactamase class C family)
VSTDDDCSGDETAYVRDHFGEQDFAPAGGFVVHAGETLPALVWERPEIVGALLPDCHIPTTWYDDSHTVVTTAEAPGRYIVYGEAPTPNGSPLRRAMTCCCVGGDTDLAQLADASGITDAPACWRTSEAGAVELLHILATGPHSEPRPGQWQMDNASMHVRLKRQLLGCDDTPPVAIAPRSVPDAAPTLHVEGHPENAEDAALAAAVRAVFDDWYADSGEPMAAVVARGGRVHFAAGYGEHNGQPMTVDTPMLLHSAMKPLFGVHLGMYLDRGIFDLDEPIGHYLQDFAGADDALLTFRAGHVHVSGIYFPWDLVFSRLFYFDTWDESLIAHCPREWPPGSRHRYGVVGIILALRALELKTGRNYWQAMEDELFAPLGIANTYPGGTGFSAEAMARIGVLLANRGRYGQLEFFSERTYEALLPTALSSHFPEVDMDYGIGLCRQPALAPEAYGHGGGCGTQLLVDPARHLVLGMSRNDRDARYGEHFAALLAALNTTC